MNKLSFILAVHNHQPVGNFESIFEKAYQKAYLPFLKTLKRHPKIKIVLHYSGTILSWLKYKHYDFLEFLKALVHEGRVELLSGGFYEPMLSAIPEKDRIGQMRKLNKFINDEFGYIPKGMWLAERVWEPDLPRCIALSSLEYLPVDDYLFKLSGFTDRELRGYFITEADGYAVKVFPGNEQLRYLVPFKDVSDVISYLRKVYEESGSSMITLADDGEKFGIWPGTHEHVYTNGWLDSFFNALAENSDWLEVTTYADYLSNAPPIGRIYLPAASYREMGKWALLSDASGEYEKIFDELKRLFGDEKAQGLIRGGFWKNFFTKYPEANHVHKRMLQISRKVHQAISRGKKVVNSEIKDKMLDELWQAQCNDAYWHGIFGGLYLPHLRSALYNHLLKAERLSEGVLSLTPYLIEEDIDKDGYKDLFISTETLSLFFSERGGRLCELSYKEKAVNITDILTRRYEPYHKKLLLNPVNQSDVQTTNKKDKSLIKHLIFDSYRKASLIDHFIPKATTLHLFKQGIYNELWDQLEKPYVLTTKNTEKAFIIEFCGHGYISNTEITLKKMVFIEKNYPAIKVIYEFNSPGDAFFCTEFNLSFLGSPTPSIVTDSKVLRSKKRFTINSTLEWRDISEFTIKDDHLDMSVLFKFDESVNLWHFPLETVSLSESGIEKVYQGTTFIIIPNDSKRPFGFTIALSPNP
jgi:alpha-amylase